MESHRLAKANSRRSSKENNQASAAPTNFFMTPEKKTKPCNYSPEKKPTMDTLYHKKT